MASKKRSSVTETEPTKYQKFNVIRIHRSQIGLANYNPRKLSEESKAKLKKNIKTRGLQETLVWNENTGNLVSGHQRIGILDELNKGQDYYLDVAKVFLSDKEEKEQNVFFNNVFAMGDWDLPLLSNLIEDSSLNFSEMGFSQDDLNVLDIETGIAFDNLLVANESEEANKVIERTHNDYLGKVQEHVNTDGEVTAEDKKDYIQQRKQDVMERSSKQNSADLYVTVFFKDQDEKDNFMTRFEFTNKFISGTELVEAITYTLEAEMEQ